MPYHICEVSSVVQTEEGASEHGVQPYYLQKINSKFPMESWRPWGRQLYAFLGIFYLPRVIDEMWVFLTDGSDIQPESVPNVNAGRKHWCSRLLLALLAAAIGIAPILILSAFSIVFNLVCALLNVRYYLNSRLSMRGTIINGEEVWEISVSEKAEYSHLFSYTTYQGDRIKVAFGPFEYWCLFRKQMQSDDATALEI
ncbi:hypothetical protein TrST_g1905 [Triparma strigata]|uniref:Uncharacterized protein n=1 Tax=Triparma strigata TaxID=1606541 RepID=A0A9W7BTI1_9STRA|nr:hypothetical protein TrST_g1905 [Triparma strigata]